MISLKGEVLMKTVVMLSALVTLIFSSSFFLPAQDSSENDRDAMMNMFQRHDDAMNQQNLEALVSMYSPAQSVILGTGPGERYEGREEIKMAYSEFFKDFDKGT